MTIAKELAEYAASLSYEDLGDETRKEAKRRMLDMLACSIGAYEADTVKKAAEVALGKGNEATVFLGGRSSIEMATFANTAASRYLDFMDTYFYNGEYVHPEDSIAGILAAAETEKASGKDVILSVVLSYEVACRLVDFVAALDELLREDPWRLVVNRPQNV